jgi:predicted lysophospholipase L1 biosynthesis ABC-type transport system permease subunit
LFLLSHVVLLNLIKIETITTLSALQAGQVATWLVLIHRSSALNFQNISDITLLASLLAASNAAIYGLGGGWRVHLEPQLELPGQGRVTCTMDK